jgi:FKBP-type peptidyl-prolyl cis-trans isomerase FklB
MKRQLLVTAAIVLWAGQVLAANLSTDKQRFSYMIGLQVGQQLKNDNVELDESAFLAAIKDAMSGAKPQLSKEEMQTTLQHIQQQQAAEAKKQGEQNRIEGEKFLAANKDKPGVKVTASGLQYKVIKPGTGAKPKPTDNVVVDYRGTLIDGREFDSSYARGEPATFPVNGVIKGWQEALQLMKEGAKWQIYVPADLAYGERGAGGLIGPNATLIFDVELHKIKK